jgi:hypothetical protein
VSDSSDSKKSAKIASNEEKGVKNERKKLNSSAKKVESRQSSSNQQYIACSNIQKRLTWYSANQND